MFRGILMILVAAVMVTSCHKKQEATSPKPVKVKVMCVADTTLINGFSYPATIQASENSPVGFTVGGTVKSINVKVGDKVSKGQLLATLDDASLRSAYEMTQATLAEAKDVYQRMKLLHERKALADIKWVEVQSKLKQAQAATDLARTQMRDAKLYAPFNGVVSQKFAELGQAVAPTEPVLEIMTAKNWEATVSIPENKMVDIKIGDTVRVVCDALDGLTAEGKISEKGVKADPISRTYIVKVALSYAPGLLDGMVAKAILSNASKNNSESEIILPMSAVALSDVNVNFVWLDSMGVATRRNVEIGRMTDEGIVISSGLGAGDKVIVSGQQKVSQGSKVEIDKAPR